MLFLLILFRVFLKVPILSNTIPITLFSFNKEILVFYIPKIYCYKHIFLEAFGPSTLIFLGNCFSNLLAFSHIGKTQMNSLFGFFFYFSWYPKNKRRHFCQALNHPSRKMALLCQACIDANIQFYFIWCKHEQDRQCPERVHHAGKRIGQTNHNEPEIG